MTPKAVIIGYERRINRLPGLGPKAETARLFLCGDHGLVPSRWVGRGNSLFKCCEFCIRAHCKVTEAVLIDSEEHIVRGHS